MLVIKHVNATQNLKIYKIEGNNCPPERVMQTHRGLLNFVLCNTRNLLT